MLKASHFTLIFLSGLIWLAVGCFLLPLGLNFIIGTLLKENINQSHPLIQFLAPYVGGGEQAAMSLIVLALFVGFLKGRKVFAKSVQRSVNRIITLPNPTSISQIYTPSYYLLLGSMILLGVLMRFTPQDVRGFVDVTVGSALINGAFLYFKSAWLVRQTSTV